MPHHSTSTAAPSTTTRTAVPGTRDHPTPTTRANEAETTDHTRHGDCRDHAEPADDAVHREPIGTAVHTRPADFSWRDGVDPANRGRRSVRGVGGRLVGRGERGAVTAELALALPVLVLVLLLGIWSIGLVVLNIRCIDAARDVARAVARGEPADQAKAIGRRTVPNGTISITRDSSDIHVTVTAAPTHKPPLLTLLTPAQITATATLQAEPDAP